MSRDQQEALAKFECFVFSVHTHCSDGTKFKSTEPDAGHMTCKIGPQFFTK